MSSIYMFDTTNNSWTYGVTKNTNPFPTLYHTAVLNPGGNGIIMYGGVTYSGGFPLNSTNGRYSYNDRNYTDDVWTLHVSNSSYFYWTRENTTGPSPGNLIGSNAFLFGDQMLVMFGRTFGYKFSNKTYILNVTSWAWVQNDNFTFKEPVGPNATIVNVPETASSDNSMKPPVIAAIALGMALFLLVAGFLGCCFVRHNGSPNPEPSKEDAPPNREPSKGTDDDLWGIKSESARER